MNTFRVIVKAKAYQDEDNSLLAAEQDVARSHGLELWEVNAFWTDDSREEITVVVTSA